MNTLIINGSPKGDNSVTLQTALYLQKLNPKHQFTILPAAQRIRSYEKDFSEAKTALENADLLLFVYPVYTFVVPYQLHRFVELMKENDVRLAGKYASQITTSKHFYDVTAHKFIEENCLDMGMKFVRGLSADMEDLLSAKGQKEARSYFRHLLYCIKNEICTMPDSASSDSTAESVVKKRYSFDVVIVSCCRDEDTRLREMIDRFRAVLPTPSREVNLYDFPFAGGCLGCLNCAATGQCVYKDGFENFLRHHIQNADAIIYAFPIMNHFAPSILKEFDDRQFCNGHRTVTEGSPVGYLISGPLSRENNLKTILEARSEVGKNFLAGIVSDENDTNGDILKMSKNLIYALRHRLEQPQNFYGVGGGKIFRDLIYTMRGMMKADHEYYKAHGEYDDFPQRQPGKILMMKMVGLMLSIPAVQKEMKTQMSKYMLMPYQKVIEDCTKNRNKDSEQ